MPDVPQIQILTQETHVSNGSNHSIPTKNTGGSRGARSAGRMDEWLADRVREDLRALVISGLKANPLGLLEDQVQTTP